MKSLLSGNDLCGSLEAIGCHYDRGVRLILSTDNITGVQKLVECARRLSLIRD